MGHTWYVTYQVQKRGTLPKARHPRLTKAFETEMEAKNFAREKFHQGLVVTAGTLNPFKPKQIIPPVAISSWIETGPAGREASPDADCVSQTVGLMPRSKDRS